MTIASVAIRMDQNRQDAALEGAGGAWLHVVSPAAQFAQDARVLNAALEDLERPFESIGLVEEVTGVVLQRWTDDDGKRRAIGQRAAQ